MIPMPVTVDKHNYSDKEFGRKEMCDDYRILVLAETSDQLFHVRWFVDHRRGPRGNDAEDAYYGLVDNATPYKTVGYDVHKYDPETGSLRYMDRSLDSLAFFIGSNNGFAIQAHDDEVDPDCIYYTGPPQFCGGHDVVVFDYQDQTLTHCFYPPDMHSIERMNTPIWSDGRCLQMSLLSI
ncbi:hypothetical protein PHJA_000638700 [Phtheirospermum japonicum]|uniref:KIB1-4 beta-propeller domain-containing protein n=1 Tax=Phtheirospermum japonicum TaxID=374723 RepID=A0A830BHS8_9LAMI|nr:hypothetical protein PHJA_000638700 [Phtheirospermum japonicum]